MFFTCTVVDTFETQSQISKKLGDLKISPLKIQMSALSVILYIDKTHLAKAVEGLHGLIDDLDQTTAG